MNARRSHRFSVGCLPQILLGLDSIEYLAQAGTERSGSAAWTAPIRDVALAAA